MQLLVILIASHFSWDFGAAKWLADTIMATDVTNIMEDVGYTAFSAIFWSQFALLALVSAAHLNQSVPWLTAFTHMLKRTLLSKQSQSLLICGWVAWSFKTGTFPFVWPIKFVRFFGEPASCHTSISLFYGSTPSGMLCPALPRHWDVQVSTAMNLDGLL